MSAVLSVSVEKATELISDVFLGCVFLSGTMRSAICVLLEKTASVIFLMLMPWGAIFSMAKSSFAERTILVVRILVKHLGFETKDAVVHGFGVMSQ